MLLGKLNFPNEFRKNWNVLEGTSLPSPACFCSSLTDESTSAEEYGKTQLVWRTFQLKTIGELADLYLKVDVLLLVSVFEKFRKHCLATYKLDPPHYFTLPSLSWDAMLRKTRVRLEIIRRVDKYIFFEAGIRGGFACAVKRYAKANHQYLDSYDETEASSYIVYCDFKNI